MRLAIFIQARMGSSRLPGKVLKPFVEGTSILELLVERLRTNRFETPVVVVTSQATADDAIERFCASVGVGCFRGSEGDVLARFLGAARAHEAEGVVRACADNPFLRLDLLEQLLRLGADQRNDYVAHAFQDGLPAIRSHLGFFSEFVRVEALRRAEARLPEDSAAREHVTAYIYDHPGLFDVAFVAPPEQAEREPLRSARLTVDTPEDFATARALYASVSAGGAPGDVALPALAQALAHRPEMREAMQDQIQQNAK